MFKDLEKALVVYGYKGLLGCVGIEGPGNLIVIFAGPGDFYTACLSHDMKVLWCHSCGGYNEYNPRLPGQSS